MTTPRTATAATLLTLAALTYSAWTLEAVLDTGLPPAHTYVSELAATNQPYGTLFRTTDLAAGLLVCAAALTAPRTGLHGRSPWTRVGRAGLLLFGAATAIDSRLPLSCTPTTDPACAARETAGLVPPAHTAHTLSSTLALCGVLVAMVALTRTARRYAPTSPQARASLALAVLEPAATAWTLAAIAALESGGHDGWGVGLAQRLQVGVIAVWLATQAVTLLRAAAASPPPDSHASAPAPVPTPTPTPTPTLQDSGTRP
ncbi:hypothetical protein QFZ75_005496 [Streptomyces sp. V3I8]|uniref:DUF998 domain-containing protein n=1 Tax=Streptomyces sp. V3I8 TaxID=3042279 RepID=UPI00278B5204|nr:DUF998 domain-containing protein [Streptomyces sp. V3I8]MDQ1039080.1 hypothetical protein [Streptomyces sp. V3I8]